ncbi:MAG: hypothetical protein WC900_02195 [Oscillospiraceae bacterium]
MLFAVDWESLKLMSKYALVMLGLLLLVYFLAVLTPKLAKLIDRLRKNPARVEKKSVYDLDKSGVKSIYDPQTDGKNESCECNKFDNGDVNENGKG